MSFPPDDIASIARQGGSKAVVESHLLAGCSMSQNIIQHGLVRNDAGKKCTDYNLQLTDNQNLT